MKRFTSDLEHRDTKAQAYPPLAATRDHRHGRYRDLDELYDMYDFVLIDKLLQRSDGLQKTGSR